MLLTSLSVNSHALFHKQFIALQIYITHLTRLDNILNVHKLIQMIYKWNSSLFILRG